LTAIALVGASRLDYSTNPDSDLRGDDIEHRLFEELHEEFGSDHLACVLLVKTEDIFTPQVITALRQLVSEVRKSAGVAKVYSIDDVFVVSKGIPHLLLARGSLEEDELQEARHTALAHPLAAGQLLSPNADATVIIARLGYLEAIGELSPIVRNIRDIAGRIAADYDLEVFVTGTPALLDDALTQMRTERIKLVVISCSVTIIIALLLLRNVSAIIITSTPHMFGILWTVGAMGWMRIEWTMLATAIPPLLTAIGFTDSVHLMLHMRHEVATGSSAKEGAILAIRRIGIACALTSLTTGVGFASLLLASRPAVRDFGGCCAIGCVLTFIAVITLVPLLSGTFLGRRCAAVSKSEQATRWNYFFDGIIRCVLARPKLVTVFSVLITIGLSATALKLKPDVDIQFFPPKSDSMQALKIFEQDFGGGGMIHALVDWQDPNDVPPELTSALNDVHTIFDNDPFTSYPISVLNLLQSIGIQPQEKGTGLALLSVFPKDLVDQFVHLNQGRAIVNTRCPTLGGPASIPAFSRLEQSLAELSSKYERLRFRLTGAPLVVSRSLHKINVDLAKSLGFAAVIIFGIITLEFRSFRYGLICLIPNIFPLAAISAYLFFARQSLQTLSILVFTICLGIAVDDTIHFMTRFRTEFRECCDAYQAIRRSFAAVGKALVITTIIFIFCFGSCATSTLPMFKHFASLACIGFAAALAGDILMLPALLFVSFGSKTQEYESEAKE
jgi:predicted RND superfamily exporter protein